MAEPEAFPGHFSKAAGASLGLTMGCCTGLAKVGLVPRATRKETGVKRRRSDLILDRQKVVLGFIMMVLFRPHLRLLIPRARGDINVGNQVQALYP